MRRTDRPSWIDRLAGALRSRRGGPEGAGSERHVSDQAWSRQGLPPTGPRPVRPLARLRPWVPPSGADSQQQAAASNATRPIITPPGGRGGVTDPPQGGRGRPPRKRPGWLAIGLTAAVLIALVSGYLIATRGGPAGSQQAGATPGKPEALTGCTATVADSASARRALDSAGSGARICLRGNLGNDDLLLRRSGTEAAPITILGGGTATVGQITVRGDHVVVDGVRMSKPRSPGFLLVGNDIAVRNSEVDSPQVVKKNDDGDGIRFFGDDIKIVNNVIRNVVNLNGQDGNHADAIQTFATSDEFGPSKRVLIDGNRFEDIDNMCLIAEGPDSEAGDGIGEGSSGEFTVTNNYCDNGAGQAFFFDDISDVTLKGNTVVGKIDKAFSLQNDSTDATIQDNHVGPKVGFEVGMDDSSEDGYDGPDPGGDP